MTVSISTLNILGSKHLEENRLPKFRDKIQNKSLNGSGLLESEREMYGYQTGDRLLPYTRQDIYTRERNQVQLKTVTLENDYLKAIFLVEYGMRLYSLYDKKQGKELLYVNPVFQIANLAIREAWFSGGIEWNIGQLGHTFTTCESLYVARCEDEQGESFVRCYEYERCKGIFWNIDFHLPKESTHLCAYVRIINPKEEDIPFYWWTNIAVPEEKDVRVLSGTDQVIYINPECNEVENGTKGMSHGALPYIKALGDRDASYPGNFDYSSEYFFQNEEKVNQTWEAVVYNDGHAFYERSTPILRYRKMFCWGNHNGGKRWKEFLSTQETGNYLEIQAGMAPTQVHGMIMPAHTTWDFVQVFGGCEVEAACTYGDWNEAKDYMYEKIEKEISEKQLGVLLKKARRVQNYSPIEILHTGNGFGTLEALREPTSVPEGLIFPLSQIGEKELPWLKLLKDKEIVDINTKELPTSWMVDLRWKPYLEEACSKGGYMAYNHLGVMAYENGDYDGGIRHWETSIKELENPLAYRNLYRAYKENNFDKALDYMEQAIQLLGNQVTREYIEEYLEALTLKEDYAKVWSYYQGLSGELQTVERIRIIVTTSALKMKQYAYLEEQYGSEFAVIREGERAFTDHWFEYQALLAAKYQGIEIIEPLIEQIKQDKTMPYQIDFRLSRR